MVGMELLGLLGLLMAIEPCFTILSQIRPRPPEIRAARIRPFYFPNQSQAPVPMSPNPARASPPAARAGRTEDDRPPFSCDRKTITERRT